jgi:hypothetical protein
MVRTAPALYDLAIGDTVHATFDGPWWTGRTLTIVDFILDGDIAIVREIFPYDPADEYSLAGTVKVPSNLLARV